MAKKKKKKAAAKKGKAKGKKKAARKAASRDMLIVASKVKAYVRGQGYMASGELMGALNDEVYATIDRALERTSANKRSTARPQDV